MRNLSFLLVLIICPFFAHAQKSGEVLKYINNTGDVLFIFEDIGIFKGKSSEIIKARHALNEKTIFLDTILNECLNSNILIFRKQDESKILENFKIDSSYLKAENIPVELLTKDTVSKIEEINNYGLKFEVWDRKIAFKDNPDIVWAEGLDYKSSADHENICKEIILCNGLAFRFGYVQGLLAEYNSKDQMVIDCRNRFWTLIKY